MALTIGAWRNTLLISQLRGTPLVAVFKSAVDGPVLVQVDELWQIFALAWWNAEGSGGLERVQLIAAACWLSEPAQSWQDTLFVHSFEDLRDWENPKAEHVWCPQGFRAAGFVEDEHYTVDAREDTTATGIVEVQLTVAGQERALEYAKGQIEKECAAEGKPVPWDPR